MQLPFSSLHFSGNLSLIFKTCLQEHLFAFKITLPCTLNLCVQRTDRMQMIYQSAVAALTPLTPT